MLKGQLRVTCGHTTLPGKERKDSDKTKVDTLRTQVIDNYLTTSHYFPSKHLAEICFKDFMCSIAVKLGIKKKKAAPLPFTFLKITA